MIRLFLSILNKILYEILRQDFVRKSFWPELRFRKFSKSIPGSNQGCQMVCFQTKNTNLGKIWRALD
jgi:hypothetical protein